MKNQIERAEPSRSMQKRIAAQKGEKMPTFGAEPSRGAPERAAKFYLKWANDSYGVYPDRKLPSEHWLHFAASFAASEHVVLLEALRTIIAMSEPYDQAALIKIRYVARAAIQQAERT